MEMTATMTQIEKDLTMADQIISEMEDSEIEDNIRIAEQMLNNTTRTVHFDDNVVVHHYYQEIPCLQEFIASWNECKECHLKQQYIEQHGSLEGFSLLQALKSSQDEDEILDDILFRDDNNKLYEIVLKNH